MPASDGQVNIGFPDGDRLQQIMKLAAAISGQKTDPASDAAETEPAPQENAQSGVADGFGGSKIAEVLPIMMQAFSGGSDFVKSERVNLVNAMRPYISAARADSMDRAIRMANIAKAAQTALGILGR